MKTPLLFVCLLLTSLLPAQQTYISEKLARTWQTPAVLKTPESVCYDHQHRILFVSNIAGGPSDKDQNGFISTLSPEGEILQLEWAKGLNAPKGMGISGNELFVADIDEIVVFDIPGQKLVRRIPVEGSLFLNDIAVGPQGDLYVSDMNGNALYRIRNYLPECLIKSGKLNHPNGLCFMGDDLVAGLRDRMVVIHLRSRQISDFVLNTGSIDGIVSDGKGCFIFSDWLGNIHRVKPGEKMEKLLDTTAEKINAADIEWIADLNLLLVPTFGDNRVMAYRIE